MGAKRKRKKERGRRVRPRSETPGTLTLARRALKSFFLAFPTLALVGLIGAVPLQLAVTWLMQRQGIVGDALWEWRYQGFADWIFGSLIAPALYFAIYRSIVEREAQETDRKGRLLMLGASYRRGVSVWLGMFLTRMKVSFAVMIPALPLLGGLALLNRRYPELGRLMTDPSSASSISGEMVLYLVLLLPLLMLPLFFYLRYSLTECVVALERTDGFEALRRSRGLTDGVKTKLLVGMILLDTPVLIVSLILEAVAAGVSLWAGALATAVSMVLAALPGAFLVHVYIAKGGDGEDRRRVDRKPEPAPEPK